MESFSKGERVQVEGQLFTQVGHALISKSLADLNNLKVGDEVTILDPLVDASFKPLTLKISGIYSDYTEFKPGFHVTNPKNDFITSYVTLKEHQNQAGQKLFAVEATYFLKHPDLVDQFNKEAHEMGLHENYKMATNEMSYNKIVKPAENIAHIANVFLYGILGIGSVILILLSIISIRERNYEIGVLRAMGVNKAQVVRGIIYESLIIMTVCLLIGLTLGSLSAQPMSEMLVSTNQATNGGAVIETEPIEVSLSGVVVVNVLLVGFGLVIISSSVGVLHTLRYEPMQILSERGQ